jgi:hypothetical protein
MKKIYLMALVVFSFTAVIKAGEIEGLKGLSFANLDFEKMAEIEVAPALAVVPTKLIKENVNSKKINKDLVGQDLVYKLGRIKNDLWRLKSDTTWLDNDIDKLEREARNIASSGNSAPFFESDLRRMSYDITGYMNDARRIYTDIHNFLNIAVKSEDLNRVARDMEWDARDLYNDAQFDLERAARNLEYAVRSAKPEIIGYNSQWKASEITRNVRDYSWKLRDIYFGVQDLKRKTQP